MFTVSAYVYRLLIKQVAIFYGPAAYFYWGKSQVNTKLAKNELTEKENQEPIRLVMQYLKNNQGDIESSRISPEIKISLTACNLNT